MRVLFLILALLGVVLGTPAKRGENGVCVVVQQSQPSEVSVAENSGSEPSSSWTGSENEVTLESQSQSVQNVVYYNYVPVQVPVTTTCSTTGTIVIENDITIDVTIVPTVFSFNANSNN
jgi:hypothetical protein